MNRLLVIIVLSGVGWLQVIAGNPDRAGEAGAYELLINPWARSSGFHAINSARVEGIESMMLNVAGMTFASRTEITLSHTRWLSGSGVSISAAGLAQSLGKHRENVLGVSIMSVGVGEIERTTVINPEGGIGTFKPTFMNMGLAYARAFSASIRAGVVFRLINQRIDDLSATGFAIDAGIQYITGKKEHIRFGIALRNVGSPMKYVGNGLTFRGSAPQGDFFMSQSQRTERFQLPVQLHLGGAYDFLLGPNKEKGKHLHRITLLANFTSNAFGKDHIGGGAEYSFRELFMLRGGYRYENGLTKTAERTNAHTGFAAGLTVNIPITKKKQEGPMLALDYSYRTSNPYAGTHCVGTRINL